MNFCGNGFSYYGVSITEYFYKQIADVSLLGCCFYKFCFCYKNLFDTLLWRPQKIGFSSSGLAYHLGTVVCMFLTLTFCVVSRLSLQYHPDKNKNKGAQAKFEEINNGNLYLAFPYLNLLIVQFIRLSFTLKLLIVQSMVQRFSNQAIEEICQKF